jgi:hypothetical protein
MWLCALLVACDSSSQTASSTSAFRVEVLGATRKAVVDRTIFGSGATQVGEPSFNGGKFLVTFEADSSLDTLIETDAGVVLSVTEPKATQVTMKPYVCGSLEESYWEHRNSGDSAVETHQVILTESGEWKLNTDFTRQLSYRCDFSGPGNDEGIASIFATKDRCDGAEAVGTEVQVKVEGGLPDLLPQTCQAIETNRGDGVFFIQMVLENTDISFLIHAGFCFPPEGPSFPVQWSAGDVSTLSGCVEGTLGELTRRAGGEGPQQVSPTAGSWTVQSATFGDPGSHTTSLHLEFQMPDAPAERLTIDAVLKGPIYRVAVEAEP